jgi:hypothetical protein
MVNVERVAFPNLQQQVCGDAWGGYAAPAGSLGSHGSLALLSETAVSANDGSRQCSVKVHRTFHYRVQPTNVEHKCPIDKNPQIVIAAESEELVAGIDLKGNPHAHKCRDVTERPK